MATSMLALRTSAYGPDCFAFEVAIVWRDTLIIGFGSHVHAIALADRSVVTVALEQYYGYLYPTPDYLLIASGERLFRMQPDRSVLWRTEILAIDGVVVHDPGPPIIQGEAEQDPPGGWEPFAVSAVDGCVIPIRSLSPDTRGFFYRNRLRRIKMSDPVREYLDLTGPRRSTIYHNPRTLGSIDRGR